MMLAPAARNFIDGRAVDAAIDLNVPLITNARLASAFINAFCTMTVDDIAIKSWAEYK